MSKKILYIVNDINFFVSHRLEIALSAKKEGFQIHVASPRSDYKFTNIFLSDNRKNVLSKISKQELLSYMKNSNSVNILCIQ